MHNPGYANYGTAYYMKQKNSAVPKPGAALFYMR